MKINKRLVLTTVSIVGVMATGVAAYKTGAKTEGKKPSKENWKSYILPTALGGATIASIVVNHRFGAKEVAALTATAAYLASNRDALEQKIEEKFGKEALQEIKQEIHDKQVTYNGPSIEDTGKGDLLCLEGYSGRWFWSSKEAVEEAQRKLNEQFKNDIYCCLNDFYDYLGIAQTHFGHQFGWVNNEDWYDEAYGIEFANSMGFDKEKGQTVMYIDLNTYPMECWQEI